jgi:tripartite-type tricarboxylate transporter receptor subunit TctC
MEKLPRRKFLHLFAGAASLPALSWIARAQSYPSRPLHIVIGGTPGATLDVLARLIGQWLSDHLGQPLVVDSKPGAGTNIATEFVVRAPPDGYTLLLVAPTSAINTTLYHDLGFDFLRDIAPVAGIARVPNVLLVNPSFPAKSVTEFIAYAKAHPGEINMASPGIGTSPHMAGELFQMMTGTKLVHVPYKGEAPALTDLLGGQVQVMFSTTTATMPHIRAGTLRALAVSTATRFDALPNLPTIASFVPGYETGSFYGVGAPKRTPAEIIDRLNLEINAALMDPKISARLADLGGTVLAGSPADFRELISDETDKWAKVIKFAGLKAE